MFLYIRYVQSGMIILQVIDLQGGVILGVLGKMGIEALTNFQLYRWCIVLLHSHSCGSFLTLLKFLFVCAWERYELGLGLNMLNLI